MINPELEFYRGIAGHILAMVAQDEDPRVIHEWLSEKLGQVQFDDQATDDVLAWEDSFEFVRDMLESAAERVLSEDSLMEPPWASWRRYLDEFVPGMLYLLAGLSGAGKTSYAETVADYLAARGFRVTFVHLELSHVVMMQRRLSRHSGVDVRTLRHGMFWDGERYRVVPESKLMQLMPRDQARNVIDAEERIRGWSGGVHYVHASGWNVDKIVRQVNELHAQGRADLVIVDYLGKIEDTPRQLRQYNNEHRRDADKVEQLKRMAERLQIPVLLLDQLRKDARGARHMSGEQVRGAGEKHEKANFVAMVRRVLDEMGDATSRISVRIDKNTMGDTGSFEQAMVAGRFLIADLAERGNDR